MNNSWWLLVGIALIAAMYGSGVTVNRMSRWLSHRSKAQRTKFVCKDCAWFTATGNSRRGNCSAPAPDWARSGQKERRQVKLLRVANGCSFYKGD